MLGHHAGVSDIVALAAAYQNHSSVMAQVRGMVADAGQDVAKQQVRHVRLNDRVSEI